MTFREFEDLQVDSTVNAGRDENLARYFGVSVQEMKSVDYEIEGNDDGNCGYQIMFGERTPKSFLEKVGADNERDVSVPPHAVDGEDIDYDAEY